MTEPAAPTSRVSPPPASPPPEPEIEGGADTSRRGPLAWMAQNSVAANLAMLILIVGGIVIGSKVKQEVFPEFDLDLVMINVPYPGASPAEVEQGVILAIEEAVRGLDGVLEVRGTANEGIGVVAVELLLGTDPNRALADVKAAVDRITSFPVDAERPVIALATRRSQVLTLMVHGDVSERQIRGLAERTREELLSDPRITYVELGAVRPYEISINVPQEALRRHGLTIDDIAGRIRQSSVEIPGGGIKTRAGEVLVRTAARRTRGSEFEDIVLLARPDGSQVRVRDIATVDDGFSESDQEAFYDGERAAMVSIYRVGDQTPLEIAAAAKEYVAENADRMPAGVSIDVWNDMSEVYRDRVDLLLRNAWIGLILVLLVLGLFLELRLAFWVTLGIPISFIGSLLFMPVMDVSINMISLFAFIVTLGMVVDDAIVVGEAVYKHRQEGMGTMDAAIAGVREVAQPVVFSILTTCVAFSPLLFVPGTMGKFFMVIPMIVIVVLLISLVESLFVLPAHLAHESRFLTLLTHVFFLHKLHGLVLPAQQRFARLVEELVRVTYVPAVRFAIRHRYAMLAAAVGLFVATTGLSAGGRIGFTFMPRIESDLVTARVEMPFGTAVGETRRVKERLDAALEEVIAAHGGRPPLVRGIFSLLGGSNNGGRGGPGGSSWVTGSHLAETSMFMRPLGERSATAAEITRAWREAVGEVAGVEKLTFSFSTGPSSNTPIDVELSHPDLQVLEEASAVAAQQLRGFAGVRDVDDGFAEGKEQLDFRLTPEGRAAGLTELELARQVRSAFFGAEAVRQQRGRDEVRVFVRRPEAERRSMHAIEQLVVRAPSGGEIPLAQAATITRRRSYTSIRRVDARRVVDVTADVEREALAAEVQRDLLATVLPRIAADVPGLRFSPGGQQKRQEEALASLFSGFGIALVVMFGLLAIAFRRYLQPLVVMSAIPFGYIGAVLGHVAMGYDMSLMSMMGIVALSGVVVNDSLILVDAANRFRRALPLEEAILAAGARRFRPIILTSLTTFFGLAPMILETSMQARFLIPMALSLGFGVLFATFIILLLVPVLYVILEDALRVAGAARRFVFPEITGEPRDEGAPSAAE